MKTSLIYRCYRLARPYGRRRFATVFAFIILAGLMQMLSVVSIFPFLKVAADPNSIHEFHLEQFGLGMINDLPQGRLLFFVGLTSIVAMLLANLISLCTDVQRFRYAHGLGAFLRVKYLHAMASQPYAFFLQQNSGALLQRVNEAMQFTNQVFLPLLNSLSRFVTVILLVVVMIWASPFGFLGGAVLASVYASLFVIFKRFRKRLGQRLRSANRGAMMRAQQFFGGIKSVFVAEKTSFFIDAYAQETQKQARLAPWIPLLSQTPRYIVEPLVFGGLIMFLLTLTLQDSEGLEEVLPTVSVMAFAAYRMLPAVQQIFAEWSVMHAMLYTLEDIEELYDFQPVIRKESKKTQPVELPFFDTLTINQLEFTYPLQTRPALEDVSFEIPKRTSIGIMGSTGSGKSTLVDTLLGLHKPQCGEILVDDQVVTPELLPSFRMKIGYIPQSVFLLDDTIAANIAFGVPNEKIDLDQVKRVAAAAQILEFIETELADGFQTQVGERGVRLSGGQIQRIGIARALYHDPEILVFDEATSALDNQTEEAVVEAIRELSGDKTMIVIAHRLTTLRYCDQIVRLEKGRIVERGSYEEVVATTTR